MAKSRQTSLKKERESKKRLKKQNKEERKEARKANSNKGKGFDSMIAYVNEFGHLSDTPPDPRNRKEIRAEDISLDVSANHQRTTEKNTGSVTYFNEEKGYGFIKDSETKESVFFHLSNLTTPIKLSDKVSFEVENGPKGRSATGVERIG